jgi:hypothetical protein
MAASQLVLRACALAVQTTKGDRLRHGEDGVCALGIARLQPAPSRYTVSSAMKQEASFFENKEPVLIYIAKRLRDALRLENILAAAGVDYGVETDEYRGGIIFHAVRTGAFFYVLPETVPAAHDVMRRNGYKPFEG